MSAEIDQLTVALCKAHGEYKQIIKDATGRDGNRSYRYVTLQTVIDAVDEALAKNGLVPTQIIGLVSMVDDDGVLMEKLCITTMLLHTSGQWMAGDWPLPVYADNPKDQGKVITYYRRYALQAALGVTAEEDDDGGVSGKPTPAEPDDETKIKLAGEANLIDVTAHIMMEKEVLKGWYRGVKRTNLVNAAVLDLVRRLHSETGLEGSELVQRALKEMRERPMTEA